MITYIINDTLKHFQGLVCKDRREDTNFNGVCMQNVQKQILNMSSSQLAWGGMRGGLHRYPGSSCTSNSGYLSWVKKRIGKSTLFLARRAPAEYFWGGRSSTSTWGAWHWVMAMSSHWMKVASAYSPGVNDEIMQSFSTQLCHWWKL